MVMDDVRKLYASAVDYKEKNPDTDDVIVDALLQDDGEFMDTVGLNTNLYLVATALDIYETVENNYGVIRD